MAEKTPTQQLAEKLLYTPAYAADKSADVKKAAADFAEGYRKFLDNGKTEREVAAESEQMLKDAGYQLFDPKKTYAPGDKVYFIQLNKAVVASTIGTRPYVRASTWSLPTPTAPAWICAPTLCTSPTISAISRPTTMAASASISGAPCRWPSTACSPVPTAPPSA